MRRHKKGQTIKCRSRKSKKVSKRKLDFLMLILILFVCGCSLIFFSHKNAIWTFKKTSSYPFKKKGAMFEMHQKIDKDSGFVVVVKMLSPTRISLRYWLMLIMFEWSFFPFKLRWIDNSMWPLLKLVVASENLLSTEIAPPPFLGHFCQEFQLCVFFIPL